MWQPVIGLEVHVQLATKSKIFSGASTHFGAEPNAQACAIDLGLPGVLPVLNEEAIRMALRFGLAIDAEIPPRSIFARKNYFYPDLPKGYQISQYEEPIVGRGQLLIHTQQGPRAIRITRAHLEEDAGKSLHEDFHSQTGIDLNRAGMPLLEIVSEPDLYSAEEAVAYLKALHALITYLDISDGNMAEGSMRCDINISLRQHNSIQLGTRAEIKNVNSFRFVEKAIAYEIERQSDLLDAGKTITQETRLYDADKNQTRPMRSKEEANDYRYFPDPDLLPVDIDPTLLDSLKAHLPELPEAKRERFVRQFGLSEYDASIITSSRDLAAYFEQALAIVPAAPKLLCNWITSELLGTFQSSQINAESCPISPAQLGKLVLRIHDKTLSTKTAKQVFDHLLRSTEDTDVIIQREGLQQVTDTTFIDDLVTSRRRQPGSSRPVSRRRR
ncbi:MAG: Asp-tRNA(Asn)/Glu-tRNA(Gln) amidotransferase subunit GatB, partial [Gammaproteobacteria bacterium]